MSDEENKLTHMPEEFQDALKDLPEDKRKNIYRSFSMVMGGIIPQSNPIVDKLTNLSPFQSELEQLKNLKK